MQLVKVFLSPMAMYVTLFFSFLVSTSVYANVQCPKSKVERIYNTADKVYVQMQGFSWHVLGFKGDADLSEKIAVILEAERGNHFVKLVFPNGYDDSCMVMDDTVAVKKVKLKKRKSQD